MVPKLLAEELWRQKLTADVDLVGINAEWCCNLAALQVEVPQFCQSVPTRVLA